MKKITIRQAILDAIDETDEQIGRYPNQLLKWSKYIEKEIGSALGYPIKSALFTVTGCKIDLPDDCYRVIGLFPGVQTEACNIHYRNYNSPTIKLDEVSDDLIYAWIPENTTWVEPMMWEEIGDQLNTVQEYDAMDMTLVYQYIETDDKGYWLVNESHIDAIKKYLIYRIAYKFRWKVFKSEKLFRSGHQIMVKDLERDYNIAVRHARALDGSESEFERVQY